MQRLNCNYPILSAPMAFIATAHLAKAVSSAGGFGMIGAGYCEAKWLQEQFEEAQNANIGIGFITWYLQKHPEQLESILPYRPKAIMFSFGDFSPFVDKVKQAGILIIAQVQTVADAKDAEKKGADFIVAQGTEAGGHGASRGTFSLIPAVVDNVCIPVIAAGGIADRRGFLAASALGAQGVLMGTRFYASKESGGHQDAKQHILMGKGDQTFRSHLTDHLRGVAWPKQFTARIIQNDFFGRLLHLNNPQKDITPADKNEFLQAQQQNNFDIYPVFAGECIDLIDEILPVDAIIKNIMGITD
ncbi:NAD(P)H-dependent flavin oxidoreductase [Legionella nagasakiensis]|uniref:NAD(P)H-dependent flavin oxidoreductase n=1 Tax=Legionella nagasakiensis TaxID=535290 RepID=UPI0013EF5C7A|nr:nitronate monooxygenase [Legionella nagasakiensis]